VKYRLRGISVLTIFDDVCILLANPFYLRFC
jgi:hypothetical protein